MDQDFHKKFRTFLTEALNTDQQHAVTPRAGVFVVRAGAGSGKTRVITARILNLLLEHDISPASIVALTFTNKAAREMQERVTHALPGHITPPTISTFHSYGLKLLKRFGALIGIPTFTIMDSADREKLLQTIIKRQSTAKKVTANAIGAIISRYKNSITSHRTKNTSTFWSDPFYYQVFQAYEQERRAARCLDFDDLLLETLRLLETQPACKEQLQKNIQHILVDEYQDTNRLQHAIIQQFAFNENHHYSLTSLCIVGDENQSIYSWRGATVDNMAGFTDQFPDVNTIAITQNYRSVQPILQTANAIIRHNRSHTPHDIWSHRPAKDRVRFVTCATSYQEGEVIASCAKYFQKLGKLSQITVLYRSHFQSRSLEEAFVRNSIPYKIIGGTQFYDRQEIKDLLAYIRLASNPFDRISFARCINTPARTLGDAFLEQYMQLWSDNSEWSFHDVAATLLESRTLPLRKHQALEQFCTIIIAITSAAEAKEAFNTLIARTSFIAYLTEAYELAEAQERIANVHELVNAVAALAERGCCTISALLDEIALVQDHVNQETGALDYVRLMTLHSAKGLEFDTVIIPGLEEGIFPSTHAWQIPEALEEERRLLYVGITRAQERLIFTRALTRFMYGNTHNQSESRFVAELPAQHVHHLDATSRFLNAITHDLTTWLKSTTTGAPVQSKKQAINVDLFLPKDQTQNYEAEALPQSTALTGATSWKKYQQVFHATFGMGIIQDIEHRTSVTYLMIQFARGLKKIDASFVQAAPK